MKKMKFRRVISALLMLAMLVQLAVFVPAFAADDAEANSEAVELLESLGVFNNEELESYTTRGEFAVYAARMLGIKEQGTVEKRYFKDVDPNSRAAYSIHGLYERGLMKGTADGVFSPDELIDAKAVAIVLLRMAGYSSIVKNDNYDEYIVKNNILSNVKAGKVTGGDVAEIIYSALRTPMCIVDNYIDNGNFQYSIDKDYLLLEELFDIYRVIDVINGAAGVSLSLSKSVDNGFVMVGDVLYEASDKVQLDALSNIGMLADAYIRRAEDGYDELVWFSTQRNEKVTDIPIENLTSPVGKDLVIRYHENNRSKSITLPQNATVLKNGERVKSNVSAAFNAVQGNIRVVNSGEKIAAIISAYDSVLVSGIDLEKKVIYPKHGERISIDTDTLNHLVVYNANGSVGSVSDIEKGMMLTVYRSSKSVEIHISNKAVTGKIETIGKDTLIISGEEYKIEPAYKDACKAKAYVGTYGSFMMNIFGEIAYFTEVNESLLNYGILIDTSVDGIFSSTMKVKIFTAAGEMKIAECADKIRVDGERFDADEAYDALVAAGEGIISQMVAYDTDADGKIKSIDTVAENSNGGGIRVSSPIASKAWNAGRILAPDTVLKANGTVFQAPARSAMATSEDRAFAVGTSLLTAGKTYSAEAYTADAEGFYSDAAIIFLDGGLDYHIEWTAAPQIVADIYEKIDAEGDVQKVIKVGGLGDGTSIGTTGIQEYVVSKDLMTPVIGTETSTYINYIQTEDRAAKRKFVTVDDISVGDIVYLKTDNFNEVVRIFMYHDYDDPAFSIAEIDKYKTTPGAEGRMVAGYVLKKDGIYSSLSSVSPLATTQDEVVYMTSDTSPAIIYDPALPEDPVYLGKVSEVVSAEEAAENASVLIPFCFRGYARIYIVYKDYDTYKPVIR